MLKRSSKQRRIKCLAKEESEDQEAIKISKIECLQFTLQN